MRKVLLLFLIIGFSCKTKPAKQLKESFTGKSLEVKYAKNFTVKNYDSYKILTIINPWPNANKTYTYLLKEKYFKATIKDMSRFDAVINIPIKRIVATSTTHIPSLDLLNTEETLVGFPGLDYISTKSVRKQIEKKCVAELGKTQDLNTEILLSTKPNVVIGFGVDGLNKTFNTIKKAGIPVIFNADWVEETPLAKAEWIKFFGALYNKQKQADSIFNTIETNYLNAKKLVNTIKRKPTAFSGAMHQDIWYLPSSTSTEGQLLKDAGIDYLWPKHPSKGSLTLSFETVYNKAKHADLWISPSYYKTKEALVNANHHYRNFKAFKNSSVYSFSNTVGEKGGVLYYELGLTRPDLVLKDLIKIAHPNLLPNYNTTFFNKLPNLNSKK